MSSHTPGPWRVKGTGRRPLLRIFCGDHDDIKTEIATVFQTDNLDYEANARLIAAAPELLAALKKAHAFIDDLLTSNPRIIGRSVLQDYARFNEVMIEMPAAIVKAEGAP